MPLANVDSPIGFYLLQPKGKKEPFTIRRQVAGSRSLSIMVGDAYTLDGSAQAERAEGTEGTPDTVRGIVMGIDLAPLPASAQGPVSQDYITAADAGAILGIEDESATFRVQITTIAVTDLGKNANLVNGTNSTLLRQSRQELDGGTLATSDFEFRVQDLLQSPADNAFGAFAKVVAQLRHTLM